MNLDKAKKQARANADFFGRPYYVVDTSMGIRVEREPPTPANAWRIWFVAQPKTPVEGNSP